MVVNNLAQKAKLTTATSRLKRFNSRHHTFLSKRFDRSETRERLHFASAITLLQHSDGDDGSIGASYLEFVEFIIQQEARPAQDLEQLWRRIVFFICVSNVDDHLRNHGFLLEPNGWVLSPAYDMNPVANGNGLKLNISETDNSQDLELAKEVAQYFRINLGKATEIIQEVTLVVKGCRKEAGSLGISQSEQERMAPAFRVGDQFVF